MADMVTVVIRPRRRTEIRGMPWEGKGQGYRLLADAIKASRDGQVKYEDRVFTVSRPHTAAIVKFLAGRYGHVRVIQYAGQTKCVAACWGASPDTALECECSCAGENHGTQRPLERLVDDGDLSVSRARRREYDVVG